MTLPNWPPKDWRAFLALAFSVIGAAMLTALAVWQTWILWRGGWSLATEAERLDTLGLAHIVTIGGVLAVLLSLGLAINRRSIRLGKDGLDVSGGDDE